MARANAVRDFLVKYGAGAGQIEVSSRGKLDPKYAGQKDTYVRTDEARWMNRRVALTVLDDQGRTVGAGGAGDAIRAIQPAHDGGLADCCSEVLKRLDKLDAIERMLMDLADQNKKLADEVARLRAESGCARRPRESAAATAAAGAADYRRSRPGSDGCDRVRRAPPKFQLLGMNLGANSNGDVTLHRQGPVLCAVRQQLCVPVRRRVLLQQRPARGPVRLWDWSTASAASRRACFRASSTSI